MTNYARGQFVHLLTLNSRGEKTREQNKVTLMLSFLQLGSDETDEWFIDHCCTCYTHSYSLVKDVALMPGQKSRSCKMMQQSVYSHNTHNTERLLGRIKSTLSCNCWWREGEAKVNWITPLAPEYTRRELQEEGFHTKRRRRRGTSTRGGRGGNFSFSIKGNLHFALRRKRKKSKRSLKRSTWWCYWSINHDFTLGTTIGNGICRGVPKGCSRFNFCLSLSLSLFLSFGFGSLPHSVTGTLMSVWTCLLSRYICFLPVTQAAFANVFSFSRAKCAIFRWFDQHLESIQCYVLCTATFPTVSSPTSCLVLLTQTPVLAKGKRAAHITCLSSCCCCVLNDSATKK